MPIKFHEYVYKKQESCFLTDNKMTHKDVSILEFYVLRNIYNVMGIHEREEIENEHQQLINEFAFLAPVAAPIATIVAAKLFDRLFSNNHNKANNQEKEKEDKDGILSLMYKAIKTLGIIAVVASLIFVGFQFEYIRSMFPFLNPFMDKISENIATISEQSFKKLTETFPALAMYFAKKASELGFKNGERALDIINQAGDYFANKIDSTASKIDDLIPDVPPSYKRWSSNLLPSIDPATGEKSYPVDTRTGMMHGDYLDPKLRNKTNFDFGSLDKAKTSLDKVNKTYKNWLK
jgi:hypothetical protein